MNLEKYGYTCEFAGGGGGVNAALIKNIESMIMRFKPILGMQIQRNGMEYVSKRKARGDIVLYRIK